MELLPVIAVRPLDARVGSTLLMRLLASAGGVVVEPGYADGERRYLSYCLRIAEAIATPWDPARHPDATQLHFGPADRAGPIPFEPSLVDIKRLAPTVLRNMWQAVSEELLRSSPDARYYAEKLVGDSRLLYASGIPLQVIDLVRDPRDVICSQRAFSHTAGRSLEDVIARQLEQVRTMAATPAGVRRILIRYEDLIADLSTAADRIGESLGMAFDPRRLLELSARDRLHMTSPSPAESVGRWRHELDPELADRLWAELGPLLGPMGYEPG